MFDTQTRETRRLSVRASDGAQSDGETTDWASISADGRYVTFSSTATDLVDDDTNTVDDVFRALNQ